MQIKLLLEQKDIEQTEVTIKYRQLDKDVNNLIQKIESCGRNIVGEENGRQYKINITDIYYIECVDKKTFLYTADKVYRTEHNLRYYAEALGEYDFVQVSKSCILNMNVLTHIKNMLNSRMQATLINGEKITVSRTYLAAIKTYFSKEDVLQ